MNRINHTISLNDGRTITGLEQGTTDGSPVVYLHGSPGSCFDHYRFEEYHRQQGIRLIAINRPGTGGSSADEKWDALSFANDLQQVFDRLEIDKATLVGFSAGGIYGCAFAQRYPERVTRLALLSSTGPFDHPKLCEAISDSVRMFYEGAKHSPEALLEQLKAINTPEALHAMLESIVCPSDQQILSQAEIRGDLQRSFTEVLQQGLEAFIKEIANVAAPWGFSPEEITVDTRLWHGTADQNVSIECCRYLSEAIPNASAKYLEGVGHYFSFAQWPELLQQIQSA